jgi:surface antigen
MNPSRLIGVPLLRSAACVAVLALLGGSAAAQNWVGLLKNTPAERFTDEDRRLFLDASSKALSDTPPGQSVQWQNPASGSRGELKVMKVFTWRDLPCRQLRITSETTDRKGSSVLNLCQVEGQWKLVSPSELKKG